MSHEQLVMLLTILDFKKLMSSDLQYEKLSDKFQDTLENSKLFLDETTQNERVNEFIDIRDNLLKNLEHDIRTPFFGIYSAADYLFEIETDLEKKKIIEKIKISSKGLLNYLNNILEFTRIENQIIPVEKKSFSLYEVLNDVYTDANKRLKTKKILFEAPIIGEDVPSILIGDYYRLKVILNHLIDNAIKFTEEGFVRFSINLLRSETANNGKHEVNLKFSVQDTGIGVDAKKQHLIFNKFYFIRPSNKELYSGLGFGLYVVQKYLKDLNGKIDLVSEVGKGSEFIVSIPFMKFSSTTCPALEQVSHK